MNQCQHCDDTFATRSSLKRHISTKHRSEIDNHGERRTRHQCTHCRAYFVRRDTLGRHVRNKHNGDLSTCSFCSKQFRADYIPQHRATCARKYWQKIEQHANLSDNVDLAQSKSQSCYLRPGPPEAFEDDNLHFRNERLSQARDQNHTLRIVQENIFDSRLAAEALAQALQRFQEIENVESYKAALVTALRLNISISTVERTNDRYCRFYQLRLVATYFDEIVRGVRQINDFDDYFGTSTLYAACAAGFAELLEPLYWRGACFDAIDDYFDHDGEMPLNSAIGSGDIDTVRYALALGSDPNLSWPLDDACTAGRLDIVTLLLEHGADINQISDGMTLLSVAVDNSDLGKVRLALSLGADPNVVHPMDNLIEICLQNDCHNCVHGEMACLLIEHGANVSRKDWKESTIFHYAASKAHTQLLSMALRRINSPMILDVVDEFNLTPLQYLFQAYHMVPLHQVRMTTSMLLKAGADVNVQNTIGQSALTIAATEGCEELVQWLLDAGADVNLQNSYGQSALMLAAREGSDGLVRLLLDAGANVKTQCHRGQTALSCAADRGHGTTVKLLLEKAPPTAEDSAHLSFALEKAVKGDYQDVVEQLLSFGADSSAGNVLFSALTRASSVGL